MPTASAIDSHEFLLHGPILGEGEARRAELGLCTPEHLLGLTEGSATNKHLLKILSEIFHDSRDMVLRRLQRILLKDATLTDTELLEGESDLLKMIKRTNIKMLWLESRFGYYETLQLPPDARPEAFSRALLDPTPIVLAVDGLARKLYASLQSLRHQCGIRESGHMGTLWDEIGQIRHRFWSRVVVPGPPDDPSVCISAPLNPHRANRVVAIGHHEHAENRAMYFGEDKRKNVAALNQASFEELQKRLQQADVSTEEWRLIAEGSIAVPAAHQGIAILPQAYPDHPRDVLKASPDRTIYGLDTAFAEGLEGQVQRGNRMQAVRYHSSSQNAEEQYTRYSYVDRQGTMFLVGFGPIYFGDLKKTKFMIKSGRQIRSSMRWYARTGRRPIQPTLPDCEFRYRACDTREISDDEAFVNMMFPGHGTRIIISSTPYHLLGQSGKGKSEIVQCMRIMKLIGEMLHTMSREAESPISDDTEQLAGLKDLTVEIAGDDLIRFFVQDGKLVSDTPEKLVFNREDNLPKLLTQDAPWFPTIPVSKDGVLIPTSNTRIMQEFPDLRENFDKVLPAENFILVSNCPSAAGYRPGRTVQELSLNDWLESYRLYRHHQSGTTDQKGNGEAELNGCAGREFWWPGTLGGDEQAGNVAKLTAFAMEHAQSRGQKMQCTFVNTRASPPSWQEHFGGRESDDVMYFCNTAADMLRRLPISAEIKRAIEVATTILGRPLSEVVYRSHLEEWSREQLASYLRNIVERRFD